MSRWLLGLIYLLSLAAPAVDVGAQATQAPVAGSGVIIGSVRDPSGTPVVGAAVQAVVRRKRWLGPYYETPVGPPDASDDRGQFRLHSLPPGAYVVAVALQQPRQPPGQAPAPSPREITEYVRTFNPGATSLAEAQVIAVQAGTEQTTEIRLARLRFVSVSGVVRTASGEPAANFDVWLRGGPATVGYTGAQGGFMTTMVAGTRSGNDGSFLLSRVPAGSYVLAVTNGSSRRGSDQRFEVAETPIEVQNDSLSGVTAVTAPGATVSGRLEWQGRGPAPWPGRVSRLGSLRAAGVGRETDFGSIDTNIQPDGTFQFTNLYGLRRLVGMSLAFNWTVKSIEAPPEVMNGPNIEVRPGRDITDVKVIIIDRPGTLMAAVFDEASQSYQDGSVLLMPRDPKDIDPLGWGFRATQRNRGEAGAWYYAMEQVLPGPYLAVAIGVEPYRLSADTDLMERARAAAIPIEIGPGMTPLKLPLLRLRPFLQGP
jgi:hypothetical protein